MGMKKGLANGMAGFVVVGFRPGRMRLCVKSDSLCDRTVVRCSGVEWSQWNGCEVVRPVELGLEGRRPLWVHFLGGAGIGAKPKELYGALLSRLAEQGYVIIACPVGLDFDHRRLAREAASRFSDTKMELELRMGSGSVGESGFIPVVGIGHSLGAKLHIIMNSDEEIRSQFVGARAGNILISYNNFSATESIPRLRDMVDGLRSAGERLRGLESGMNLIIDGIREVASSMGASPGSLGRLDEIPSFLSDLSTKMGSIRSEEFEPSPEQVRKLIRETYNVDNNCVLQFLNDRIDDSNTLYNDLSDRFSTRKTLLRRLNGTHLTPISPDLEAFDPSLSSQYNANFVDATSKVKGEFNALAVIMAAYLGLRAEQVYKEFEGRRLMAGQ